MKVDLMLLKRIDECISRGATGCPDCFAEKLGISLRTFHQMREFMINKLSAPIAYSRYRQTYFYKYDWEFYIGDLHRIKSELIKEVLSAINQTVRFLFLVLIFAI